MMKKFYSLIIALFAVLTMFAGEVTEQQALQKAQQFKQANQLRAVDAEDYCSMWQRN